MAWSQMLLSGHFPTFCLSSSLSLLERVSDLESFFSSLLSGILMGDGAAGDPDSSQALCTRTKSRGCWWPCPRRMLRKALCSLVLIAGPKQLVSRCAPCSPVPAAAARGKPPQGRAGAQLWVQALG